jgi:hypothetical protein
MKYLTWLTTEQKTSLKALKDSEATPSQLMAAVKGYYEAITDSTLRKNAKRKLKGGCSSLIKKVGIIPGSGKKFQVAMGMGIGTAKNSGYGYTHFWVWPKVVVWCGYGYNSQNSVSTDNYSISMFNDDYHNNTHCFHFNLRILTLIIDSDKFLQQNLYSTAGE